LKKKVEVGTLIQHSGAVNAIEFYGAHMLSGGQDGQICVWETKGWECLVTLKAHKGGVIDFSVHPSGKVALSIGKDKSMKLWDLVKGKSAFKTRLVRAPQMVRWSPGGDTYCLVDDAKLTVYNAAENMVIQTITPPKKITSLAFITSTLVALGCEEGILQCWDIVSGKMTHDLVGHKIRVRTLSSTDLPLAEDAIEGKNAANKRHFIVSGSSEGMVKVWELSTPEDDQQLPISINKPKAEVNVDARITTIVSTLVFKENTPEQEDASSTTKVEAKDKAKKKIKKRKAKQEGRVVVEEDKNLKDKKRKRSLSPMKECPIKNQNKAQTSLNSSKEPPKKKLQNNEQPEEIVAPKKRTRIQKEEAMITSSVFESATKKFNKAAKPETQNNQLLNPGRPKKTRDNTFGKGARAAGKQGKGGVKKNQKKKH